MKLFQALSQVSATRFPKVEGERRPDYKAIFIDVVSMIFEARKVKFDRATVEKIAQHINLSSYQRAAASEAAKRYGKMNEKTGNEDRCQGHRRRQAPEGPHHGRGEGEGGEGQGRQGEGRRGQDPQEEAPDHGDDQDHQGEDGGEGQEGRQEGKGGNRPDHGRAGLVLVGACTVYTPPYCPWRDHERIR
jgi:hypothetical protein